MILITALLAMSCAKPSELGSSEGVYVTLLSKELASKATGNDIAKILTLAAWVHASLAPVEDSVPRGPDEALEMLVGACGVRDLVLQRVLNQLGYTTRRTSFYDVPVQIGHTATEVLIDGKWRFIDASIGAYFADPAEPSIPLSIAEARALFPNVQLMQSTLVPWQKKWLEMLDVSQSYSNGTLFQVNNANTLTHPLDPSRIVFYVNETYLSSIYTNLSHPRARFEIPIDLDQSVSGNIGSDDDSSSDLAKVVFSMNGSSFYDAGLWFLGRYFEDTSSGVLDPTHRFVFSTSSNRTLTLKLHFSVFSSDMPKRLTVQGSSVRNVTWNGSTVAIVFDAAPAQTTIDVSMTAGSPAYHTLDYISWQ